MVLREYTIISLYNILPLVELGFNPSSIRMTMKMEYTPIVSFLFL